MSYGYNSVDDISRAIIHSGGMKDKKGVAMCEVNAQLIYDHIKSLKEEIILLNCKLSSEKLSRAPRLWKEMKEENEKLKKENKSITSHRDRLLRGVKRLTKAAEEWDEGTNHLAIQILNQSQELDKVKKELEFLKKENETRRASWGN